MTASEEMKQEFKNSYAVLYCHDEFLLGNFSLTKKLPTNLLPEKYIGYTFDSEHPLTKKVNKYTVSSFEIVYPSQENEQEFQYISNKLEGLPVGEIWKMHCSLVEV